ncbi:chemotaxis protein CheW [Bacillus sp. 2205SS5-2]|uniref:chemotaxis protein CheW n=1 Tax=Bacillus sp. 2205SS5-2 TaxID=3109031 RepID=UPI003003BA98
MSDTQKVVVFQSGTEEYALPIENVISIEKLAKINPIPHLPNYVSGIVDIRNELVPVLDFEQILYGAASDLTDARMIVIQSELLSFAVIVKEAKEILDVPNEAIKQVGLLAYSKTKYFTGVVHWEQRLITYVSPGILVKSLDGIKEIEAYLIESVEG